jgi:hypothetical protein
MTSENVAKVAVLWRGSREARDRAELGRYAAIFDSLRGVGLDVQPAVYLDEAVHAVREQLLGVDAVLVWVNPDADEGDRSRLDPLLSEVASRGAWVSAHPEVILKMGTKEVLVRTRDMTWGCDSHLLSQPGRAARSAPEAARQWWRASP